LEGKTNEEREDVLQRSRLFYYNRLTGCHLTAEDIQLYRRAEVRPQEQQPAQDVGQRTLSFAELKELIESGKTDQIPNNRQIPNDLHTASPSTSSALVRKKPWELAQQDASEIMQETSNS